MRLGIHINGKKMPNMHNLSFLPEVKGQVLLKIEKLNNAVTLNIHQI